MASAADLVFGYMKVEDSPEPELLLIEPVRSPMNPPAPVDPRDPEGFLKRCSGFCKKTKLRCSAIIGKKSQQNTHPAFLPTCSAHREQQSFAGWCQFQCPDGERCARLFRWRPPYFELCEEHQGHPDTPCYLIQQLPLEIRHEIYRYLLPIKPIGSSTAAVHQSQPEHIAPFVSGQRYNPMNGAMLAPPLMAPLNSLFPMPLLDLLLVSRQFYREVKDLLFSITTFKIDVRRDGTFMCGRRLLDPQRTDGSSHFLDDEADSGKKRFLKAFDFSAVKNYSVDILLENWANSHPKFVTNHMSRTVEPAWDEEVEIYDIRDYISVVVSGILAKSTNLCKLQVRVCLADFEWEQDQILANSKLLVGPLKRLRNVRQANLGGVFEGKPHNNSMYSFSRGGHDGTHIIRANWCPYAICSVPSLPTDNPLLIAGLPQFDAYTTDWRRCISSTASKPMTEDPQIRKMFTEFKNVYTHLSTIVPDVTYRSGRHTFLHRARVAREQEDVISFRQIRSELIHYWELYLAQEEQKKRDMDSRLGKLFSSDLYPSHEWEAMSPQHHRSPSDQSVQSPVLLDVDNIARDGIPMTGNSGKLHTLPQAPTITQLQNLVPNGGPSQVSVQQRTLQAQQQVQQQAYQAQQHAQQQVYQAQHQQMMHMGAKQQTNSAYGALPMTAIQQAMYDKQVYGLDVAITNAHRRIVAMQRSDQTHPIKSENNAPSPFVPEKQGPIDNENLYSDSRVDCVFPDLVNSARHNRLPTFIPDDVICGNSFTPSNIVFPTGGEPGPSTKRRRIDSGFEEGSTTYANEGHERREWDAQNHLGDNGVERQYEGKGKGRMDVGEVICLD